MIRKVALVLAAGTAMLVAADCEMERRAEIRAERSHQRTEIVRGLRRWWARTAPDGAP